MEFKKVCGECCTDFVVRERGKRRFARKFCSNKCQAISREKRFRLEHGYKRPFRRIVSDATIQKGLDLILSGVSSQKAAEQVGVSVGLLLRRSRELGYNHKAAGRCWTASKITMPSDLASLGYIAGIVDGEGSIVRVHNEQQTAWRVSVANTNTELLDYLRTIGGSVFNRNKHNRLGTKPCFAWVISSQLDVLRFLNSIKPYMIIKKSAAVRAVKELQSVVDSWIIKSV